jgi:hypothetical protein
VVLVATVLVQDILELHVRLSANLECTHAVVHLAGESEYIVNKLQVQLEKLGSEKKSLLREKSDLQKQVTDLGQAVDRLNRDKVKLEQEMEMEVGGVRTRSWLEGLGVNGLSRVSLPSLWLQHRCWFAVPVRERHSGTRYVN